MDNVNELILVIQVAAVPFAVLRIIRILMNENTEEDSRPAQKKIRHVLIALVIIELIFAIVTWANQYWKFYE